MTNQAAMYAEALWELAQEGNLGKQVLSELDTIAESVREEPRFLQLLSSPNLTREERCGIVHTVMGGKVHPYVENTLRLMVEKGSIRSLPGMCVSFRTLYNTANNILTVDAVSARPLTDGQKERLTAKLRHLTGKTIDLRCRVDETCLGGLRLDYDGKRMDGSVRHRLDAMRSILENTVL